MLPEIVSKLGASIVNPPPWLAEIFCDNLALLGRKAWDGTPCPSNGWDCLFLTLGWDGPAGMGNGRYVCAKNLMRRNGPATECFQHTFLTQQSLDARDGCDGERKQTYEERSKSEGKCTGGCTKGRRQKLNAKHA